MSKILVADDEMIERRVLVKRLRTHCGETCGILEAENGRQVLELWEREKPDVLILDIEMPGITGLAAAEMIRKKDRRLPIIFLTAREEEADRIKGLEIGGDDYILKPFSLKELAARIKAHLNREERIKRKSAIQYKDGLLIDYSSKKVTYGSEEINMTGLEFAIIEFLSLNPGRVYDIDSIYEHVGGYDSEAESRVITVLIGRIRKKIKEYTEHEYIETVWGVGYRWKS